MLVMMSSNVERSVFERGFQAFAMGLYSVIIMLAGVPFLLVEYIKLNAIYVDVYYLYLLVWVSYGFLITAYLSLILAGLSVGFGKYDYGMGFFMFAFLFSGIYDIIFGGVQYLINYDLSPIIIFSGYGVIKVAAGGLGVKLARSIEARSLKEFLILSFLGLLVVIFGGVRYVLLNNLITNLSDYGAVLLAVLYALIANSSLDLVLLGYGGFLAPVTMVSLVIGLAIALKSGGLGNSHSARVVLGFSSLVMIFGLLVTSIAFLPITMNFIVFIIMLITMMDETTMGFLTIMLYQFGFLASIIGFFGLLALVFYAFANYYPAGVPTPARGVPLERTIEEVTVTERAEEEQEEGEELLEELEELEFEEFEL